jgi:hypothetical protein
MDNNMVVKEPKKLVGAVNEIAKAEFLRPSEVVRSFIARGYLAYQLEQAARPARTANSESNT